MASSWFSLYSTICVNVWETWQWTGRFETHQVQVYEYQLAKGVVLCVKSGCLLCVESGCDKLVGTAIVWKWRSKFGEWIRIRRVGREAKTGRHTGRPTLQILLWLCIVCASHEKIKLISRAVRHVILVRKWKQWTESLA